MNAREASYVLSLLDDVEQQMTAMLKRLDSSLVEHLNEEGVWLESWRDDIKSAAQTITGWTI
jgi:hypothetical protein